MLCYVRQVSTLVKLLPLPADIDPFSPEGWSLPLMGILAGKYYCTQDLLQFSSSIPSIPLYSWPRAPSFILCNPSSSVCSPTQIDSLLNVANGLTNGFCIG